MKDLDAIFKDARKVATKAFYNAFMGLGYEPNELQTAPKEAVAKAFASADAAAWRYIQNSGAAAQFPEIFQDGKQVGAPV